MPTWSTIIIGAIIAGSVPVFEALVNFDPGAVTDWRVWAVGIGAGFVRQVAVFALAQLAARRAGG